MEKMQETINTINTITKETEEIKNKQTEMNNTITEIKNTIEGTNCRITEAEEQISDLEDRMVEIIATEQNIGKRMGKKKKDNLRDLCERVSCSVIFDSAILWTVAFQGPLSMGFSRQEY